MRVIIPNDPCRAPTQEAGVALFLVLAILTILSLLGLAMLSNGLTENQISENYGAGATALMLAESGAQQAVTELRGKDFTSVLRGRRPDPETPVDEARAFDFRNPIPLQGPGLLPQRLDLGDVPQVVAATRTDDGVLPRIGRRGVGYYVRKGPDGRFGTSDDEAFFDREQPPGPDDALVGRYFVKITNNPEDPGGPFSDTDGALLIRSMGLVRMAPARRLWHAQNALALIEVKVRRDATFRTDAPLTILAPSLAPTRAGFLDPGRSRLLGHEYLGLAVLNTTGLYLDPVAEPITQQLLAAEGSEAVFGAGLVRSIRNLTGRARAGQGWDGDSNPDLPRALDPVWLRKWIYESLPRWADRTFTGGDPGAAAWTGTPDDPKLVWVNGPLTIAGSPDGAGLLVVTGRLWITGNPVFKGLILVIGDQAVLDIDGQPLIEGGVWLSRLQATERGAVFDAARGSLRGTLQNQRRRNYQSLAATLLPLVPLQWREIRPEIEP